MPFAHFQVPASGGPIQEALNHFLSRHQVMKIDRQFLGEGTNGFWLYCVEYAEKSGKSFQPAGGEPAEKKPLDYKDLMGPSDFSLLLKLKEWRKQRAKADGIDASYTIFTNAQLAEIAEKRCRTKADLEKIHGVGEKRIKNYADEILELIKEENGEDKGGDNEKGDEPVE